MAIQYILSGDTNDQGRLKINATWDEIITGTTNSVLFGEYILEQFDGTQITGSVNFPNQKTKSSFLYQNGDVTSHTFYLTDGSYYLNGNYITIAFGTNLTLNVNASSGVRYDSVYLDDTGTIQVLQGTPGTIQVPFLNSPGTSFALLGHIKVFPFGSGNVLVNSKFREELELTEGISDYVGGVNSTLLGGWIPSTTVVNGGRSQRSSIIDNSLAIGTLNRVNTDNSTIIGGTTNLIASGTSSNIFGANLSSIFLGDNSQIIGGNNHVLSGLSSSNKADKSQIIGGDINNIFSSGGTIIGGQTNIIGGHKETDTGGTFVVISTSPAVDCSIVSSITSFIEGPSQYCNILGSQFTFLKGNKTTLINTRGDSLSVTSSFSSNESFFANADDTISSGDTFVSGIGTRSLNSNNNNFSSFLNVATTTSSEIINSVIIGDSASTFSNSYNIYTLGGINNIISSVDNITLIASKDINFDSANNASNNVTLINVNGFTGTTANTQPYLTVVDSLSIRSGLTISSQKKDASYLIKSNDYHVAVASSSGATTFTLPANPLNGEQHIIKDADGQASVNNIVINGNGKLIDGSSTQTIVGDYVSVTIIFSRDFDKWLIT